MTSEERIEALECAVTKLTTRIEELESLAKSPESTILSVFEQTHRSFVPVARRMAGEG